MKKVAFLINRTIKRFDNVLGEIEYRCKDDLDCKFFISRRVGHIEELAVEAVQEGFKYIIAVGGDGSINETLNGVMSQFKTGSGLGIENYDLEGIRGMRIGLFPAGTGNDFARNLKLKPKINLLKELIKNDNIKSIDIGWAGFTGRQGGDTERFFINITDVGMGGNTVQHLAKHKIPFLGPNLNYMKAIIVSFLSYKKSMVRWTTENDSWEGKVMSMVVANGKFFGSGLCVAPDALVDDGKFSLITMADITMKDYFKNITKIKACKKIDHEEVSYSVIDKIKIEPSDSQELPIDMDGDFVGYCPLTVQCIPRAISFLT